MTHEKANHCGLFEPVCTHPDHRRKELARVLMFEGLRWLKAPGASDVYVATTDIVGTKRLYEVVGFSEAYKGYIWRKVF